LRGHSEAVSSFEVFNLKANKYKLLSAAENGELKLWNIKNGEQIQIFKIHKENITALNISPDDMYIATGGKDAKILVIFCFNY